MRALARMVLAVLIVLGAAFLWIGLPVGELWVAGQLTTTSEGFLLAVLGGVPLSMVAFGWLLYRLNGVYEGMVDEPPAARGRSAWLRSEGDERARARRDSAPRQLIDVAMTASAVAALVLMVVWFFFLAHQNPVSPL